MIVVARGNDQGKIRIGGVAAYFSLAVRHRCQPKTRSRDRKNALGIQRKYQTILYRYWTYSGML